MEQQRAQGSKRIKRKNNLLLPGLVVLLCLALGSRGLTGCNETSEETAKTPPPSGPITTVPPEEIVDSIHVPTGLRVAEGFDIVRVQCTACHSGKLVAQNRATRDGWEEMIRWMQKTQGLWPLGENEPIILDYLAKNYGPEETGRRANLEDVEWYILDLD
jgi:hypothetical protein